MPNFRIGNSACPLFLLAVLLSACAAPLPDAEDERAAAWERHRAWLESLATWRASGRVAGSSGDEGWSAGLRWRQEGERYRIQLSGPFGQGAVRIRGDGEGVELRSADGRVARAPSAEALVAAELGVAVPVSALRYWLLGRPAPEAEAALLTLDWAGRIEELEQLGWRVRYQEYADSGAGELPARLAVTRDAVEARFALRAWQVSP